MEKYFRTPNLLILFGGDVFFYWFGNSYLSSLERIMKAAKRINAKFAVPSEYLDAVLKHPHETPLFEGDLIPYLTTDNRPSH